MDQSSCLEFFQGVVGIASPAKDTEGRPCGEAQAPDTSREGVEFELRPTGYRGSRHNRVINVSALRQMTRHWEEVIDDVRLLRAAYLQRYGHPDINIGHLWRFGLIASSLPAFLLRRGRNTFRDGDLPPDVTATFKAVQGVFMTTQHMIATGRGFEEQVTVDEFLVHTDRFEIFNAPGGERACSAPSTMLREFVSAVIVDPGQAPSNRLREIVGDVDAFFRYGELAICMTLSRQLATACARALAEDMLDGLRALPEPVGAAAVAIESCVATLSQRQDGLPSDACRRLVPVLEAALSQEMHETCASGMSAGLTGESRGSAERCVNERLSAWLQASARLLSPPTADRISLWLTECLRLEARIQAICTQIQRQVAEVLNRPGPPPLRRQDVFAMLPNLTAPIEAWLGIEVFQEAQYSLRRVSATYDNDRFAYIPV